MLSVWFIHTRGVIMSCHFICTQYFSSNTSETHAGVPYNKRAQYPIGMAPPPPVAPPAHLLLPLAASLDRPIHNIFPKVSYCCWEPIPFETGFFSSDVSSKQLFLKKVPEPLRSTLTVLASPSYHHASFNKNPQGPTKATATWFVPPRSEPMSLLVARARPSTSQTVFAVFCSLADCHRQIGWNCYWYWDWNRCRPHALNFPKIHVLTRE